MKVRIAATGWRDLDRRVRMEVGLRRVARMGLDILGEEVEEETASKGGLWCWVCSHWREVVELELMLR